MFPRHLLRVAAAVCGTAMVAVTAGCAAEPSPEIAVRSFLIEWQSGRYDEAARYTNGSAGGVAAALEDVHDQLDLAALRLGLGRIEKDGDTATAEFSLQADLGIGDPVWNYTGSMPLERSAQGWAIDWSPSVVHPDLGAGERMAVSYDVPDRGQIFDRSGTPLVGKSKVTAFGVRPSGMDDKEDGVSRLAKLLGEDPDPLLNRVRSAPSEEFQPLVLMRRKDVDKSLLADAKRIPGVQTAEIGMQLNPKAAGALVGEVAGTAEHKVSSRVSGPYQAGDTVGLSGLQSVYQQRLAGTATTKVVSLDEKGDQTDVLKEWPGVESGSLKTTVDAKAQKAAEKSLADTPGRAYLTAVHAPTGEVLAAAGRPNRFDNDGAFTQEYLPGETFTMITAASMLGGDGLKTDGRVPCPQQRKVGDRTFTNPSNGALGGAPDNPYADPDMERNFAFSCATSFASLADKADPEKLARTAADFGVGADWRLSVPTFSGEVDLGADPSKGDLAAVMVGSDGVKVSPLTMALAAGAVADGTWHAPELVAGSDRREHGEEGAALDPAMLKDLRAMMRASVENGSATGVEGSGQDPVYAQTGTAEQNIDGKKVSVQWFVGYQGDVAFAAAAEVDPAVRLMNQHAVDAAGTFLQELPDDFTGKSPGGGAREHSRSEN
ncbi:cell division protein FtsI/penicillin-binding protein 2 [Murinocardiopsis flavida]|uniref:Cell division protein FtsI/penicillin-binding protein 2 n=1 Tax=Murinocardiopsis flavida TaxID=645275 RepID=A0A2P8DIY9_9ACTN|nr:penicillin-binding transpeptidase domain-containing protein [Murinocardiopsis flavida]PSK97148.1 cell division protein FtsI/penicillin-binding protein 2 [Murinocardiopsis flavida]